jgi:hypothetical protein
MVVGGGTTGRGRKHDLEIFRFIIRDKVNRFVTTRQKHLSFVGFISLASLILAGKYRYLVFTDNKQY